MHDARLEVERGDRREDDPDVRLFAQHVPQDRGDLPWGEDAGRDLEEEGLEQVVVAAVDQCDVDVAERASSLVAGRPPKPPPTTTTRCFGVA